MNRKLANERIFKYRDSFGNKHFRKDDVNRKRLVKICSKCKLRKVKFHHYLCENCFQDKIKKYNQKMRLSNGN